MLRIVRAQLKGSNRLGALLETSHAAQARLIRPGGVLSIDGLDAAVRAFGVALVVVLSATAHTPDAAINPLYVAALIVLYNGLIFAFVGVPWRRSPNFALFALDWAVGSVAILATGGFYSPFLILYYALVIGAALRLSLARSMLLVAACALVYSFLTVAGSGPAGAVALPALVVQITSLAMVVLTAVGMKRVVEVEARRVELEERAASQLRLLNDLMNTVLSASPDLERVLLTVARVSSDAVRADSGLAVLFKVALVHLQDVFSPDDLVLAAYPGPRPVKLSGREHDLLVQVASKRIPVLVEDAASESGGGTRDFQELQAPGMRVRAVACVPLLMEGSIIGVLFVARYRKDPFTSAEATLLKAIGNQIAVAVRLARLYEIERERAIRSQERERLERDLLSIVSHELRTPLTSIMTCVGALSGLDNTGTSPSGSESQGVRVQLLQNIERSTERLSSLVEELLDMGRLRAGRVTLQRQYVNMGAVVLDVAAQLRPLLDARDQSLLIDLPQHDTERWHQLVVDADRRRIEQVLMNLVSNANRHGPAGSAITVGATPLHGLVRVFVRDEGPGIPATEQGRIFERFYSGSSSDSARPLKPVNRGQGLGLAIARSIIDLHGGQIGVNSRQGQGSTFYFTLATLRRPEEQPGPRVNSAREVKR